FGSGGAVYDDQQSVVDIERGTFAGNLATAGNANGGAIAHYGGSRLTLAYDSFAGNRVLAVPPGSVLAFGGFGGAIQSDQDESGLFRDLGLPTLTVSYCAFTRNHARVATPTDASDGGS